MGITFADGKMVLVSIQPRDDGDEKSRVLSTSRARSGTPRFPRRNIRLMDVVFSMEMRSTG